MEKQETPPVTKPSKPLAQQYPSSREYLEVILDSLDDELMVVDRDFRITEVNAALLKRHGSTRSEVMGQYCYQVFHGRTQPCQSPAYECPVVRVSKTGKPVRVTQPQHYDGDAEAEERHVEILASPLRDSQGNVTGIAELIRDVTEANKLEQQVKEEQQRTEEIRSKLLNRLISAQEEERKRIARELHDETSQALTSLAVNLEAVIATLPPEADDIKTRLRKTQSLAVKTLDEIHKIIYELRPTLLDDFGLVAAVRWHAENYLEAAGLRTRLEITGEERRLPAEVETTLFRTMQEATTNIVRHASAKKANIGFAFNDTCVVLQIEDDGKGFVPDEVMRLKDGRTGLGLLSMKERMELLGGTIRIESQPGSGTRVVVKVPLNRGERHD